MPDVLERSEASVRQIGAKAWRFGAEMIEAADVFDGLGVPSGFSLLRPRCSTGWPTCVTCRTRPPTFWPAIAQ